jgi:hypothetical protein
MHTSFLSIAIHLYWFFLFFFVALYFLLFVEDANKALLLTIVAVISQFAADGGPVPQLTKCVEHVVRAWKANGFEYLVHQKDKLACFAKDVGSATFALHISHSPPI